MEVGEGRLWQCCTVGLGMRVFSTGVYPGLALLVQSIIHFNVGVEHFGQLMPGARLGEVRAVVPSGTPMIALTATATRAVCSDIRAKLEMTGCKLVFMSPNRPNIHYEVRSRIDVEVDMAPVVQDLLE